MPPLPEELGALKGATLDPSGSTSSAGLSIISHQHKHDPQAAVSHGRHRRKNSEWGDPDHLLEFAPPAQLAAAMHVMFVLDRAVKAAELLNPLGNLFLV